MPVVFNEEKGYNENTEWFTSDVSSRLALQGATHHRCPDGQFGTVDLLVFDGAPTNRAADVTCERCGTQGKLSRSDLPLGRLQNQ